MTRCTVPDNYPIIPSGGTTIYSTAANSNAVNSMEPNNDIAVDTIATGDTVEAAAADSFNAKVIDLQNYMNLTRGFTIGDTGEGAAGNCTTGTVGSHYQQTAIPSTGAIAADTPSFTFSNINLANCRFFPKF